MTQVTYPGVYIQELPSTVRTITAVTTSVTAFVGSARRGPINRPVTITSFGDFERRFGGLDTNHLLSYSVQQFFLAGGSVAIIVRVAKGAVAASVKIGDALTVSALDASQWGNGLRVAVDPASGDGRFGLRVQDASGATVEQFRSLTMEATDPQFVESAVNGI